MKPHNVLLAFLLITSSINFSKVPDNYKNQNIPAPVQTIFMQANNINTPFSTDGIFNLDRITFVTTEAGLIWPVTSPTRKTADYASGIWIGAKVGAQRELRLTACLYGSHYTPGNIPVIGQPSPSSVCADPSWRGYLVNLVDPNLTNGGTVNKFAGGRQYTITYDAWANWPIQKGAPYVEVNNIPGYQPGFNSDRPGIWHTTARPDEVLFMVYMDYTNCTNNIHLSQISLPGGTLPLGVEIQQIAFVFNSPGYTDMYFVKWRIINKSSLTWDSTYIALVDDADIGEGSDDAAGCDSTRDLGFIYNADNYDPQYTSAPPAIGERILQGPLKYTGNPLDTAKLPYGNYSGYKLLGMTGYNIFTNGGGPCFIDPSNAPAAYNFMRGRDGCGNPLVNWVTYNQTNYVYSGNSCNRTGWYDTLLSDRRQILSMGPITMNSQTEQFILSGCIINRGADNIQSVCGLLTKSDNAKLFYTQSFGGTPIGISQISIEVPQGFVLYQNYPNPFNPVTIIHFALPSNLKAGMKSETSNAKLIIYDVLGRDVATLVNEKLQPGIYEIEWNAENYPSGVYFYQLTSGDFSKTMKMVVLK